LEVFNERHHQKGRRIEEQYSSLGSEVFMNSAPPALFGGPSFSFQVDDVGNASSGCFGTSFGKRNHDGGLTSTNNNKSAAADHDDPSVLIAKAMSNLSLQEREKILRRIYMAWRLPFMRRLN
jgi:hypothetical protein